VEVMRDVLQLNNKSIAIMLKYFIAFITFYFVLASYTRPLFYLMIAISEFSDFDQLSVEIFENAFSLLLKEHRWFHYFINKPRHFLAAGLLSHTVDGLS
jgi:hypothetical protein